MLPSNYLNLPSDLSGASSKNRFRNELLWGVTKLLEIYNSYEDFAIVFDYVSDIEVHSRFRSEYYQIKTKKQARPYTVLSLCKCTKDVEGNNLPSILGKLYKIRIDSEDQKLPISVVSNTNLKHNKEYTDALLLPFTDLDEDAQKVLLSALAMEFPSAEIDLTNISYIKTTIDLLKPSNSIKGQLVTWFPMVKGCEVLQPNALFASISDAIEEKACYELKCSSNSEVIKKKAITKGEFDSIISHHLQNAITGIKLAKEWVQKQHYDSYYAKIAMLKAIGSIVQHRQNDIRIKEIEKHVAEYIETHLHEFQSDDLGLIREIVKGADCNMPSPYTTIEAEALVLLVLKRKEEELLCS